MVFSIVATGLWLASCVAGQLLFPGGADYIAPWIGKLVPIAPGAPLSIPVDTKTQYHYQDGSGFGKYGHSEATSSHHAIQDAVGNKAGVFSYLKADGTIHKTRYIADSLGYRVESNDLPVEPLNAPAAHSLRKRSITYPYVSPSGYLADTPEVAAAKASHFQEHAKRGNYHVPAPYSSWSAPIPQPVPTTYSTWLGKPQPYSAHALSPQASWSTQVGGVWPTPYSSIQAGHPTVTPDGYLKDTPEVAQAKATHLAEKAKAVQYNEYPYEWNAHPDQYNYYTAAPNYAAHQYLGHALVTPDGQVTDTPEVISAKASHFAEYEAALARNVGHVAPVSHQYAYPGVYSGAPGVPAETPEVAQAKAAHFAEYAKIAHRLKRQISHGNYPASTAPLLEPALPIVHPLLPSSPISSPAHFTHSSVFHSPSAFSR